MRLTAVPSTVGMRQTEEYGASLVNFWGFLNADNATERTGN